MVRKVAVATFVTLALLGASVWLSNPEQLTLTHSAEDGERELDVYLRERGVYVAYNLRWGENFENALIRWRRVGFVYERWFAYPSPGYPIPKPLGYYPGWRVIVPLWFVVLACLVYPVVVFIRGPARRRYRRWHGLCVGCGYDLTGNISGTCPECACHISGTTSRQEVG